MALEIVLVFVSSTWLDLKPEREAVRDAVLRMQETQFVGMEYFGSRDETTRRASLDEVDRSRVYVGVIAGRYGSGITEDEYERARQNGLPCFIYFKDDTTIPDDLRETDPAQTAKLDAFKRKLRTNHINAPDFINPQDLAAKLTADLHRWLFKEYLTPKLQDALRGEVPHGDAQALLDAVKDLQGLKQDLLDSLRGAGFQIASGERSVAYTGDAGQVNINTGDTNVYNVPAPVIPTLHQLRAPVGDFVGREKEIEELLATLRGGGSAAITGISGMGGIGKTELAFYVAARLRDTYPDAQLVLDMRGTDDSPRDPADALASCIRAFLGLEQRLPDDTEELTRLYRSVLEGKRALVLLDNAHDSAQVRPLLPPAGSALLITSRNAIALPGMKRTTLEQLEPSEARELLTGIAPRVPDDVADQICYLCGYLPLAIRAAGSLLDVTIDLDPEEYAAQLRDERTRLEHIGTEGVDISVEASFNLSYARLSPDAARVFRKLAVFPASFDAPAEEAICEDENHKHLTDLLRRNLVLYNTDTHRYRLHDLARLFADSRLSDTELKVILSRYIEFYEQQLINTREIGDLLGQESALKALGDAYARRSEFVRVIEVWEQQLTITRGLGKRHDEGASLYNIGAVRLILGDRARAITHAEEALKIFEQLGSPYAEIVRAQLAEWRGEATEGE